MTISRKQLYAAGEPFGDSATRTKPGGRVYGSGGGGSSGGTSVTTQSIAPELKPLATAYTDKAIGVGNQTFNPYQDRRYADITGPENLGIGMVQNRATGGDATVNAGANFLQNSLQSGPQSATANPYAQQGNPYLDQMVGKAQQSVADNFNTMVKPQLESSMVNSGSFGNSGLAEMMQKQQKAAAGQMSDIATDMYGGAWNQQAQLAESGASRNDAMYQNSMGNKLNAAGMGLQYGNQAYQDASQLMNAGQVLRNQQQDSLDFNFQQYQDKQNLDYKQLAAMSGAFGSNLGGSSSTQQSGGGGK